MIGEFRDERSRLCAKKEFVRGGPNKHVERRDERYVDQKAGSKRLGRDAHFLQQPAAEILKRENVASPAADKTTEDQRGQNSEGKKDEAGIDRSLLESVHGLRRLNRRDRPAADAPLNDMSDHPQLQEDERERAPAAGFRFADAASLDWGTLPSRALSHRPIGRFSTFTTAFQDFLGIL